MTTLGNPPSGIAGGYCFLDMVGIYVATRLATAHPHVPEVAARAGRRKRRRIRGMSATLPLDLERYPIDDLDSPAARELIERCRSQLDATGLCTAARASSAATAVARSAAEIQAEVPDAFRKERAIVAMNESEIDPSLPADDPCARPTATRCEPSPTT